VACWRATRPGRARTLLVHGDRTVCIALATVEDGMESGKKHMLRLLDRSLIGLLIFIVMLLLGIQAMHVG
jgi:hypothetical protein